MMMYTTVLHGQLLHQGRCAYVLPGEAPPLLLHLSDTVLEDQVDTFPSVGVLSRTRRLLRRGIEIRCGRRRLVELVLLPLLHGVIALRDPLRKEKLILLVEEIVLEDLPGVMRQKHGDRARLVRVLDQQTALLLPLLIFYQDFHVLEVLELVWLELGLICRSSLTLVSRRLERNY